MSRNSDGETTPKNSSQVLEGEIPILLPFRYDPETGGRVLDSPTSDAAPSSPSASHQSRFSFGRKARGMVDSLLPEPLKPRNVGQKRAVKMDELPLNLTNERSAEIYNEELHRPRPSSSVYETDRWPDVNTSSGSSWPYEGSSGNLRFGHKENRHKHIVQSSSAKQFQPEAMGFKHIAQSSSEKHLQATGFKHSLEQTHKENRHKHIVQSSSAKDFQPEATGFKHIAHSGSAKHLQSEATRFKHSLEQTQFPSDDYGYLGLQPSRSEKALPSLPHPSKHGVPRVKLEHSPDVKREEADSPEDTLRQFRSLADQNDMYSQLAALRVPIRRRHEACLPANMNVDEEKASPPQKDDTAEKGHIPFDPIDPYHHSGQPKKKVLYGPDGYLGKEKDWKQSNLQKVTEKVESLGNRVKRGIQRTMERDRDDNRMELLHGIVMKPSISISVDPEAQSEIYCKLELFMCTSANTYLLTQMQNNRFVGNDSVKRFVNFWKSKNRPLVPEFQFDMKTQRDIILHNLRHFDFPGKYGLDPVLLKTTLDGWRSVISQLNVRTYCWPDIAIRKLFHDVYPILEMLGATKEVISTFLNIKHLVVGLIHKAKYKKKMEELKRGASGQQSP